MTQNVLTIAAKFNTNAKYNNSSTRNVITFLTDYVTTQDVITSFKDNRKTQPVIQSF